MKRYVLNLLGLAVIIAVVYLATQFYDRPAMQIEELNPPALSTMTYHRESFYDPENGLIKLALVVSQESLDNDSGTTQDILEIYRWAAGFLQDQQAIEIWLVLPSTDLGIGPVPVVEEIGEATNWYWVMRMSLEDAQIDRLLRENPRNFRRLLAFHADVAETTGEADGWVETPEQDYELFIGFD